MTLYLTYDTQDVYPFGYNLHGSMFYILNHF